MNVNDGFSLYRAADYFNIDDILATNEKVPCTINTDMPSVGYLNSAKTKTDDLVAQTYAELPLWLVEKLSQQGMVIPQLPTVFNSKYRNIYLADPEEHNVRKWFTYFYKVCWHYLTMKMPEGITFLTVNDISMSVSKLLQERLHFLISNALYANENIWSKSRLKMDELERAIFQQALHARLSTEKWLFGSTQTAIRTESIKKSLKRPRPVVE